MTDQDLPTPRRTGGRRGAPARTARRLRRIVGQGRPRRSGRSRSSTRGFRLRHAVAAGVGGDRSVRPGRLRPGANRADRARDRDRQHLRARRHGDQGGGQDAGAGRAGTVRARSRRVEPAVGRRRARPRLREAGAGDALLSRRDGEGALSRTRARARRADRAGGARPAHAGAGARSHRRGVSLPGDTGAHARGARHPRPRPLALRRADGDRRARRRSRARDRTPRGRELSHRARLSRQPAAARLHASTTWRARATGWSTRWWPGAATSAIHQRIDRALRGRRRSRLRAGAACRRQRPGSDVELLERLAWRIEVGAAARGVGRRRPAPYSPPR